jgi:hypothetical protein
MEGVQNVRLSLLPAGLALIAGLALSACSGSAGASSSLPSAGAQALTGSPLAHDGKISFQQMPGIKALKKSSCPSNYAFCIVVEYGDSGPYVCFASCDTSGSGTWYLFNYFTSTKGKLLKAKTISGYWDPNPGTPGSSQYIVLGKNAGNGVKVKYVDWVCNSESPSGCNGSGYTAIGVAPEANAGD